MKQKPKISNTSTAKFLQERFGEEVDKLTLLSGGEWSQAYSFKYNNKKYVLRWSKSSEGFEKDTFAYSFKCNAIPIPQITDMGKNSDYYFAISEYSQGEFIEELATTKLENALPSLFRLFNALRDVDLSKTTGYGGWDKHGHGKHSSWKKYLLDVKNDSKGSLTNGWYVNLENSPMGAEVFNQLYSQLSKLVNKCPENRELIHGDLLNRNMMVYKNKINAVIDWQCSVYGDSLYDIAWFAFNILWYPQIETNQLCQKAVDNFKLSSKDISNIETRLLCYQIHIGLGSMAYNSFKKDWKAVRKVAEYTQKVLQR